MARAHMVEVDVPGSGYQVSVRPGLLFEVGEELKKIAPAGKAAVVTDSHVGPLHAATLRHSLEHAGYQTLIATIPAGEEHKTLDALMPVYDRLLSEGIERRTPLIALGGGVIGDMAGFVAATLLRGVPLIQAPTTLLAMVDASIGGKTGVNHAVGKNLIGAFHQPRAVLIDPAVLQTLPRRELRGGLAECIKHDIIRDADGFADLEANVSRALRIDVDYLTDLIAHNVAIKARVVEADPLEQGERAHLNFGHTFAHAIERVSNFEYTHGEAVGLGMVAAARLAAELGMIDTDACLRIIAVIAKAGLPTGGLRLDPRQIIEAMRFDKKVADARLRFILPDRIGHVVIRDDVPEDQVAKAIGAILAQPAASG